MLLQQVAGDDLPLHLARAFVDAQRADLAIQLLDLGALGDAERRRASAPPRRSPSARPRWRGAWPWPRRGGCRCRRRPAARRRGRSAAPRHRSRVAMSASFVLGHRIVGERAVAELAVGGKGQRLVERAPGEAERRRADRHPEQVQRLPSPISKPSPGSPMTARPRTHVVEFEPRERVRGDHLDPLGDPQAGVVAGTMKARNARARLRLRRCGRRSRRSRRCRRWRCRFSRRPAPIRRRRASADMRDVGGVRSAFRLGQREGGDRLAARDLRQPFALLLDRSEQADRARAEPLHGEGEIGEAAMAGEGLAAIARLRTSGAISPSATHSLRKPALPSSRPAPGMRHRHRRRGASSRLSPAPLLEPLGQLAVARLEERPVERQISHPGTPACAWRRRLRRRG